MVQEKKQRQIRQHHITPKLTPALQKYDSTIAIFSCDFFTWSTNERME
jgi:hypothetical protein